MKFLKSKVLAQNLRAVSAEVGRVNTNVYFRIWYHHVKVVINNLGSPALLGVI